jgi:hypothetical protein
MLPVLSRLHDVLAEPASVGRLFFICGTLNPEFRWDNPIVNNRNDEGLAR